MLTLSEHSRRGLALNLTSMTQPGLSQQNLEDFLSHCLHIVRILWNCWYHAKEEHTGGKTSILNKWTQVIVGRHKGNDATRRAVFVLNEGWRCHVLETTRLKCYVGDVNAAMSGRYKGGPRAAVNLNGQIAFCQSSWSQASGQLPEVSTYTTDNYQPFSDDMTAVPQHLSVTAGHDSEFWIRALCELCCNKSAVNTRLNFRLDYFKDW